MAMVIGAIMLSAIGFLLVGAARLDSVTKTRRQAAELGESKIEELRRTGFSTLESGCDTVESKFIREWVITESTGDGRIKEIEITVEWEDSKGRTHSVIFNTTIYRNAYPYK